MAVTRPHVEDGLDMGRKEVLFIKIVFHVRLKINLLNVWGIKVEVSPSTDRKMGEEKTGIPTKIRGNILFGKESLLQNTNL